MLRQSFRLCVSLSVVSMLVFLVMVDRIDLPTVYNVGVSALSIVSHRYVEMMYSDGGHGMIKKTNTSKPNMKTGIAVCNLSTQQVTRQVQEVNCAAIVDNNEEEINKARNISAKQRKGDEEVADDANDCRQLRSHYTNCAYSEELHYPVAYSILCHTDAVQVESLLREIYQPQNVYCIHPDAKASSIFHKAINNIARCFPNVFIASKLEGVVYANILRLQAEINCFQDLVQRNEKWKYVINLTGQMLPLKTNREIVTILKIYNGANDIKYSRSFNKWRIEKTYHVVNGRLVGTGLNRTAPVPGGLKPIKGSAYGVFSRAFINYVITNDTARAFVQWSNDTWSPDEHYWATLNYLYPNPQLRSPGGYSGIHYEKPSLATYVSWPGTPCRGKRVRSVCVFGVGDVPDLVGEKHLFANKFYVDFEPLVLECLSEWYYNRTVCRPDFNTTYYEQLPFIIHSNY